VEGEQSDHELFPERHKLAQMGVRLAIITDLHYGRDTGNVKGPRALEVLRQISEDIQVMEPEAVLELGDRLTDETPQLDRQRLLEIAQAFKRLPYPRHHLIGNHDLLPKADQEAILEANLGNHSAEVGGWKLVFLESFDATTGGTLTPETIAWLEAELEAAHLPVAVFSHQPLHGEWMQGNPYFESDFRDHACPVNALLARGVIERSGRVRVCVAGHAHWNDARVVNGIPYLTVLSACESYWTPNEASRAWAMLTLSDTIKLEVFGVKPLRWEWTGAAPSDLGRGTIPA
jgi:3',5'-cyclic-AMP phosphodiesterase